ncbi:MULTISPECIES: undecaprenyl-phosphate glucose phosphotransferase [unclassified Clostridium]|uniref:undecaprenyl-phosphate glucose phosphotransferase n=1 Tax=unclassified Clostridium TaxID=2614128 RepID=UPI000E4E7B4E|nr:MULTISPECIES: undecaprenyl-phosphate glucose phosphotransferase [unclassified Clostridium]RHP49666.1 undecaprenyl-phosphate glucose phosphotransferase [Clostridium sp. AF32-12BH]RHV67524.1 undecaprenyl-phosphate glucose phosphotransferase [Clostridium sp. OM02-18AC]
MIKDNQTRLNRLHVLLDALVIAAAYVFSWFITLKSGLFGADLEAGILPTWFYMRVLVVIIPVYLLLYTIFHLFTPKRVQGRRQEFANICKANLIGLFLFGTILYVGRKNPYLREFSARLVAGFFLTNITAETLERNLIRTVLRSMRAKGYNQKHIILVGYSRAAEGYIDRVLANPEWGYRVRGILDEHKQWGYDYRGIKVIGTLKDLKPILDMNRLDEIAITLSLKEYAGLEKIVAVCEKSGVHTKFIPDYNNVIPTRPYTEDLQGLPVINIRHVPLNDPLNAAMKRVVDIFGAVVALILFSPIMLVTAVLIKLTSPGPLIYCQERVGLHNRPFKMYKFRSMEVQAPEKEKSEWTTKRDPRVTPIGRIIRKTSIDEMPQLFNVLFGSMSLVGPRPERPYFVERFKEEIPRYMIKHQVRPGMTGWAQVNGYRGDTSITKRIEHDLYYIENWTLGFDFKILFLTFFKGFINKNAY